MDKSIVAVEESHRRSDSLASASKSFGSLVQINSIAIDISCAMEEIESPQHEHFSIRGFVAGIRKKDWKICSPFHSEADDGNDDLVDSLPPLSVPSFRWWQCPNCVPDISSERATVQMLLCDRSDAGPSSRQNVGADKYALFSHGKQKIGDEHVSRDSINGEDNCPSNMIVKYNPCCIEGPKATTCSSEKTDMRNNVDRNPCVDISETKSLQIIERCNNYAVAAAGMEYIDEDPSTRVDEPENASSGRETHRRKPKLRSLADIMEEEKNLTTEHPRTRSESTEMEADLDPHPQLDVPTDIAKGTRSPPRKRKIGLGEDRVPLEMTHPIGTAKRSKGPIPSSEKTYRRVELSDIEPEENGSSRMDLQLTAKTKQIKPKKSKALDIDRKMRRAHTENRTAPKINAVKSTDLHKHAVAAETSFNNTGPYFQSSILGQKMDRMSDLSERTGVEADHSPLMPSRKNIIGDHNVHDKVALELSLNSCIGDERKSDNQSSLQQHRAIPDLNVSFTEKTYVTQGKQLPNIPENRSLNLHKNLDMSASCSKDMAREGKRQSRIFEPQPFQNIMDNNVVEHGGASDDIPMEIVELLARNQRERALGDSRKHLLPEAINNSIRGSSAVYMTSFPFTNSSVTGGNIGVRQRIPNFPEVKNCQFDIGNNNLSSYRPSQQKQTQQLATNLVMSGPRPNDGADLLWPPRRKNVPFHLNGTKNHHYVQSNGLDNVHAFPDHYYIGKPVSDIKGREKHVEEGRNGSRPKPVGSLDAYSNDAIPAMQLLSLMDRGVVPGSSDKVGSSSFLDKTFSPCNHHPRLNGNENRKDPFFSSSFFSQSSRQTKDLSSFFNGVCFSSGSSKKSYLQGQMPPQQSNLVTQQSRGNNNQALEICTLNRNPADFSVPDAGNEYTISAKDLKPRKRNYTRKERFFPANMDGPKRPRMRKDDSAKECSRK